MVAPGLVPARAGARTPAAVAAPGPAPAPTLRALAAAPAAAVVLAPAQGIETLGKFPLYLITSLITLLWLAWNIYFK